MVRPEPLSYNSLVLKGKYCLEHDAREFKSEDNLHGVGPYFGWACCCVVFFSFTLRCCLACRKTLCDNFSDDKGVIDVRWCDGQDLEIKAVNMCLCPDIHTVTFGRDPETQERLRLTVEEYCSRGMKLHVQKSIGKSPTKRARCRGRKTKRTKVARKAQVDVAPAQVDVAPARPFAPDNSVPSLSDDDSSEMSGPAATTVTGSKSWVRGKIVNDDYDLTDCSDYPGIMAAFVAKNIQATDDGYPAMRTTDVVPNVDAVYSLSSSRVGRRRSKVSLLQCLHASVLCCHCYNVCMHHYYVVTATSSACITVML